MAKSKTSAKKTTTKTGEQPDEYVAAKETQKQNKNKKQTTIRRIAVQYTPRIPTARCPWC
jgi:hypothetical protein